jgi:hypothetical protein
MGKDAKGSNAQISCSETILEMKHRDKNVGFATGWSLVVKKEDEVEEERGGGGKRWRRK